jgi:hypothetical protein
MSHGVFSDQEHSMFALCPIHPRGIVLGSLVPSSYI